MVQDNLFNFFLPLRKELYSCLHGLLGLFLSLINKQIQENVSNLADAIMMQVKR